jgi:glycosyltransferase involved in cell wall biosynthesis
MRIVALLAIRNEALYLPACLDHLARQRVETCVIDNGSTDESRAIVESYLGRGVFQIVDQPYAGYFDLTAQLELKQRLSAAIEADWFIHHDADEIREAPPQWSTLAEGIEAMDRAGWNSINFDEFVFVPTQEFPSHEGTDFVAGMRHYYFFERHANQRVNAWKKRAGPVDLRLSAGHRVSFANQRVAPQAFVLRHYIFLSLEHGIRKYTQRVYSQYEVEQLGWHRRRSRLRPSNIRLPAVAEMKRLEAGRWDKSDPQRSQLFMQWGAV